MSSQILSTEWLKSYKDIINYICRKVTMMRTTSTQGHIFGKSCIPATILYEDVKIRYKITEQMFVQILIIIKMKRGRIYDGIEVPDEWLQERTIFHEAIPDKNKFYCITNACIHVNDIYDNTNQDRQWQENEFIWVPADHPNVVEGILNKTLTLAQDYFNAEKN